MVRLAVAQREWQANAQSAHPHFCAAQNRADEIAEFRQKRLHIAHHFQFFGDTGIFISLLISAQLIMAAPAETASKAASAAIMPVSIALWLPLMRGTLTKPAEQPISAPPGKANFGTD